MIRLALDQASHTSGYAIFDNDKLIKSGAFTVSGDTAARLMKIRNKVREFIEEYNVDNLIIEDIQLQESANNNVATFKTLAEVFGVIHELAFEMKVPFSSVTSSVWRSTLNIKGKYRADKKRAAQNYILNKYNLNATEDECDAICIGIHDIIISTETFNWTE